MILRDFRCSVLCKVSDLKNVHPTRALGRLPSRRAPKIGEGADCSPAKCRRLPRSGEAGRGKYKKLCLHCTQSAFHVVTLFADKSPFDYSIRSKRMAGILRLVFCSYSAKPDRCATIFAYSRERSGSSETTVARTGNCSVPTSTVAVGFARRL